MDSSNPTYKLENIPSNAIIDVTGYVDNYITGGTVKNVGTDAPGNITVTFLTAG